jgi:phosphate transport system ATP-binding protein
LPTVAFLRLSTKSNSNDHLNPRVFAMALMPFLESIPGFATPLQQLHNRLHSRAPTGALGREWLDFVPVMDDGEIEHPSISCQGVSVSYQGKRALHPVHLEVAPNGVLALIGPSGSGKSTFLRCLNRMNDSLPGCQVKGKVMLNGQDVYAPEIDTVSLRAQVSMIFQKPNPYPQTVYENVAYGLRIHGLATCPSHEHALVEEALRQAGLWPELRVQLKQAAHQLSPGQQQRLCIARALAIKPSVILMDEPCSALDPVSTAMIEGLIEELGESYPILLVTHSVQQAARISQRTAFFDAGRLIEVGQTARMFTNPRQPLTETYISGRMG